MKKSIGYVLMAVGFISLLLSGTGLQNFLGITLPAGVESWYLIMGGVVLVILGAMIVTRGTRRQKGMDVPIYHGKEIVGYRRLGK